MPPVENDWASLGKHVLAELKRHTEIQEKMRSELAAVGQEIAVLKFKSGLWGAVAGAVPAFAVLAVVLLSSNL